MFKKEAENEVCVYVMFVSKMFVYNMFLCDTGIGVVFVCDICVWNFCALKQSVKKNANKNVFLHLGPVIEVSVNQQLSNQSYILSLAD